MGTTEDSARAVSLLLTLTKPARIIKLPLPAMQEENDHRKPDPPAAPPAGLPSKPKRDEAAVADQISKFWKAEESLSLEERRNRYHCQDDFVTLASIPTWAEYAKQHKIERSALKEGVQFNCDMDLNSRISLYQGNVVTLELDAVQNAANKSLLGGGGIDGAIHSAAGDDLYRECALLNGAQTGETKITRGYDLPAKYVLHTVGPVGENPELLRSCYRTTLDLCLKHHIHTVSLCCVSTGIFGYPLANATHVALRTVREWLQTGNHRHEIDRIVFCLFLPKEVAMYENLLPVYFPSVRSTAVATELIWPWGGYRVQVAGAFNGWEIIDMHYINKEHVYTVYLEPGIRYQYKFIVDGEWKYNGEKPTARDPMGNVNNEIIL